MTPLPADWKEVRLGEIAEVDPENLSANTSPLYEFKYISLENVSKGRLVGFSEYVFSNAPSRARRILNDLDVLLSTVRPNLLGNLLFRGHSNWIGSTGFAVVRCRSDFYSPTFLIQVVFSRVVQSQIELLITGSNYPAISSKDVRELRVPLPPLKEQKVIAEALSDADAAIESLDALIAKKRDVKQATMQQLLTGRTRIPGFTADWKEVRLGEHAAFFKGNGLSKSQLIDDGSQQCVHYGELFTHYGPVIENVTSKCVAFDGSFKSLAGDVLMPGSDVTPRGLATASAIKVSDVVLGGDVIVIRTKPTSLYGPFLSNFIRMSKGRVLRLVKGSTVYHIHAKDLADLEVLMPPLKEQEAIAESLSAMDDELEALTGQVSKLRMVKEGMMQDLLTGKVRLV